MMTITDTRGEGSPTSQKSSSIESGYASLRSAPAIRLLGRHRPFAVKLQKGLRKWRGDFELAGTQRKPGNSIQRNKRKMRKEIKKRPPKRPRDAEFLLEPRREPSNPTE
jgi:hypothetical protein